MNTLVVMRAHVFRWAVMCLAVGCSSHAMLTPRDSAATDEPDVQDASTVDSASDAVDAVDSNIGLDPRFATFCAAARAALAERFTRCDGWAPPVAAARVNNDPCKWWGAAIMAGRMVFDGDHADECLAEMRALPCSGDDVPGICAQALWGTVKPGAPCNFPAQQLLSECEASDVCVIDADPCQGRCQYRPKLGEACEDGDLCVPGTTCNKKTRVCGPKAGPGEACGRDGPWDCQAGFYCPSAIEAIGPCTPVAAVGESPCYFDDDCVPGARCEPTALPRSVCRKISQIGDPCTSEDDCMFGLLRCADSHQCEVPPDIGQPCDGAFEVFGGCLNGQCAPFGKQVCQLTPAQQACASPAQCGPDTVCTSLGGYAMYCSPICTPH